MKWIRTFLIDRAAGVTDQFGYVRADALIDIRVQDADQFKWARERGYVDDDQCLVGRTADARYMLHCEDALLEIEESIPDIGGRKWT